MDLKMDSEELRKLIKDATYEKATGCASPAAYRISRWLEFHGYGMLDKLTPWNLVITIDLVRLERAQEQDKLKAILELISQAQEKAASVAFYSYKVGQAELHYSNAACTLHAYDRWDRLINEPILEGDFETLISYV